MVLLFVLTSCDNTNNYPNEQKEFISKIKEFQKYYDASDGNDVAQDNTCSALDSYIKNKSCSNWEGIVEEVNSGILGSKWIVLDVGGLSFKIWPESEEKWTQIGNNILIKLKKGNHILFSGTITGEMSLTCSGKMSEPEIQVEPSSISIK